MEQSKLRQLRSLRECAGLAYVEVEETVNVQSDLRVACCAVWVNQQVDTTEVREDTALCEVTKQHLSSSRCSVIKQAVHQVRRSNCAEAVKLAVVPQWRNRSDCSFSLRQLVSQWRHYVNSSSQVAAVCQYLGFHLECQSSVPVSYTHLTLPTKRIV